MDEAGRIGKTLQELLKFNKKRYFETWKNGKCFSWYQTY